MRRRDRDAQFVEFVDARRARLVRTAYLLCGDWHRAEDLVQQALVKLYTAWPRVQGRGGEDAYVRRILVNTHTDDWRRRKRRPETPVAEVFDTAAPDQPVAERDDLREALQQLPQGQRQVVVCRYWLDLSVEDTARDLGVTTGTVKSQSARGLERLRTVMAGADERSA